MDLKVAAAAQPRTLANERRAASRILTILRVGLLRQQSSQDICLLRNISAGGLRARVYRKLAIADQVEVELKSGHLLQGSVTWTHGWDIGVAFDRPIDIEPILACDSALPDGRRPRLPRIDVRCPLRIRLGAYARAAQLCDISPGGAKIETDLSFEDHGNVVLTLPDLPPLEAVVRWVRDGHAGIAFNNPLPFETLAQWLNARVPSGAPASAPHGANADLRGSEPSGGPA